MQSEVWSFGIVLTELAVGRYPIPPVSEGELLTLRGRQGHRGGRRRPLNQPEYSTFDYIQAIIKEVCDELGGG